MAHVTHEVNLTILPSGKRLCPRHSGVIDDRLGDVTNGFGT